LYGSQFASSINFSDCILNKALVAKVSNIKFRNQAPSEYLQKLSSSNPNIVDALDTHLLPNADRLIEGDYDKNFIDFLHDRYELIKKLLIEEIVNVRNTILEETVR
jgi:hypothetical protein